jgi:uncharacterized repeat protein (TIGR01451 family)
MSLSVDLTVATDRPGFSKSFAPSAVDLGEKSTLTFTVDNSLNAASASALSFSDSFPVGLEVADPANVVDTCNALSTGVVSATPGSGSFAYSSGSVAASTSCTISVDVVATGIGMLDNVTGGLTSAFGGPAVSSGKASDTLASSVTSLTLIKSFVDDPVPPGTTATLEFTIINFDRNYSATAITFSDDLTTLAPPLAGIVFSSELFNDCGASTTGFGTAILGFSGGTLPPEGSCTIGVSLSIPPGAAAGAYTNTTSGVSADVDGSPVVGNVASDTLFVEAIPFFTKEFIDDPATGGDAVTLRFTITNTDSTSALTGIEFTDDIGGTTNGRSGALPGLAANGLVAAGGLDPEPLVDPCGTGSRLTISDPNDMLPSPPFPNFPPDPTLLVFTGGDLAAAGMPGDSCTFDVVLDIPEGVASGSYPNTTSDLTAIPTGTTPATDDLIIVAAPRLTKEFVDDPVPPGGTVTLSFDLSHPAEAISNATDITFTDDLDAMGIAGLVVNLPPSPDPPCGAGSSLSAMSNLLTLNGGSLMPGQDCTFSVTVDVPALTAPANYTNTTSGVDAMVAGLAVTSTGVSDVLVVSGLTFVKEFLGDPVIAGDTVTLRFTIGNIHPTEDATGVSFSDNLAAVLPGVPDLTATLPPDVDTCGGTMSGPTSLSYSGGSVTAGATCTIDLQVVVPLAIADGSYLNLTSSLAATQGGAVVVSPAADYLDVDSNRLQLIKTFTDDPVTPGDPVTLELTLTNLDSVQAASGIGFTDDLAATLTGLTFDSVLLDTCAGTVNGTGTTLIDVSGVSLAASASCVLRLSLTVPGGAADGVYSNTTSSLAGTIGGLPVTGDPASDDLNVAPRLMFSKAFDGPTTATGSATLTFTITNPGNSTSTSIQFSDDLDSVVSGLIATSLPAEPCGPGSSISGISFLTFVNGALAPMDTCVFEVEVLVPASAAAGTHPNVTSNLFSQGLVVADPAMADLVIEPPPVFAKAFVPSVLAGGITGSLVLTIDNTASSLAADALDFTDNLPAGVSIATPSNATTSCTGGTLTAMAGTGAITYSGGSVAAASSCIVSVDVFSNVVGMHVNTTGDLTSTSGNSGTAMATLTVPQPLGFAKAFTPDTVPGGSPSTLTFVLANSSAYDATSVSLNDNLPAGMVVATPPNASTTCMGGTLTAVSGSGLVTYSGGTVLASSSCTVTLDVTASAPGAYVNTTGDLTSSLGNSGTAMATLTVAAPLSFGKSFSPDTVLAGATSTLTLDLENTSAALTATSVDVTDNLPAGVVVATPANAMTDCTGGTLTAASGTGVITYTGGTVPVSSTCAISVDVIASGPGVYVNTTGDLTSSLGNSGTAMATLTVPQALGFAKTFNPDTVNDGDTSNLVLDLMNPSTLDATNVDFTDNLPSGVVVATPSNAMSTCTGGALTAASGTGIVTYTGGTVPASSICAISVDVIASGPGAYVNTTGDLTSSLGNSGTASDTLTVLEAVPPQVVLVDSVAATGGGLDECETANVPVTQLVVTFDEDMNDPAGDGDVDDVTNPANYSLVGAGADGDVGTLSCGPLVGDDVALTVDSVSYDSGTFSATLSLNGGTDLPDQFYELFVCSGITDASGNNLDGNGDGTGGDDFFRGFRIDSRNAFVNGHLDCDIGGWDLAVSDPSELVHDPLDADGSSRSGSARAFATAIGNSLGFTQCFATNARGLNLSGVGRIETASVSVSFLCRLYDGPGCGGTLLDTATAGTLSVEKGSVIGVFEGVSAVLSAPLGTMSARCGVEISDGVAPAQGFADQLSLELGIFVDGFETGDTSQWSLSVP